MITLTHRANTRWRGKKIYRELKCIIMYKMYIVKVIKIMRACVCIHKRTRMRVYAYMYVYTRKVNVLSPFVFY